MNPRIVENFFPLVLVTLEPTCLFPSASSCPGDFTPQRPSLMRDLRATQPPTLATLLASKDTHSKHPASATNDNSMPAHDQHGPNLDGGEESCSLWSVAGGYGDTEISQVLRGSSHPSRNGSGSRHQRRGGGSGGSQGATAIPVRGSQPCSTEAQTPTPGENTPRGAALNGKELGGTGALARGPPGDG